MRGPGGRLLLGARRRLRGRRGPLLRVDAWPSCETPSARTRTRRSPGSGASERGQLRRGVDGPQQPRARAERAGGPRPQPGRRPRASASARACWRRASARVRPGLDDKRLTSWNALMIAALADAGAVLGGAALSRRGASRCAEFVLRDLRDARRAPAAHLQRRAGADRRLSGGSRLPARGAASRCSKRRCEERWFTQAVALADTMIARFADPERRRLLLDRRRRRSADRAAQGPRGHADPRGASSAALGLLRLAELTGEPSTSGTPSRCCALLREIAPAPPDRVRAPAAGAALALLPPRGRSPARCPTAYNYSMR